MKRVEAFTALATKTQHNLNWRLSLKVRSYGEEERLAGLDSRALQLSSACITCSCQGTSALAKGLLEGRRGCTVGCWRSLLVAMWGWLEEGKDGLSGCAWAWGPSLLLTHLLFPQLDVSFQRQKREGWTFASWVIFFFQLWFYGLFHKMSFPPTFCWYSLSVRFSVHAYEPRRLKQLERPASFIFFCSDPFPSPSLSMTELQSPQFSVLQLTSKYQLNTKVKRAVSPVDIGMWIPGDTSVDLTLQVLKMLGCKMV